MKLYVYPQNKNMYDEYIEHSSPRYANSKDIGRELEVHTYENAVVLGQCKGWRTEDGINRFSEINSGCLDTDNQWIKDSETHFGQVDDYQIDTPIEYVDEEVLYGGFIIPHYGHFLTQSVLRLWAYFKNDYQGNKIAFSAGPGDIPQYAKDFFALVGIAKENIIFVRKPTRFKKVLIPEKAVMPDWGYYSKEFLVPFHKIRDNENIAAGTAERIYMSRCKFGGKARCFGEEAIEEVFRKNGFKIVYPEMLTLEEQVSLMKGAKHLAALNGTPLNNGFFAYPGLKVWSLSRCSSFNGQIVSAYLAGYDAAFIDVYYDILPVAHAVGPFVVGVSKELNQALKEENLLPGTAEEPVDKYFAGWIETYLANYLDDASLAKLLSVCRDKKERRMLAAVFSLYAQKLTWLRIWWLICWKLSKKEKKQKYKMFYKNSKNIKNIIVRLRME